MRKPSAGAVLFGASQGRVSALERCLGGQDNKQIGANLLKFSPRNFRSSSDPAACMLAMSVITPSRSSRTASYRSRGIARVLAGSHVDRSPFVSLMVSSSPSVDLPNEGYVPNPCSTRRQSDQVELPRTDMARIVGP